MRFGDIVRGSVVAGAVALSGCSSDDTSAGAPTASKTSVPGTVNVRVQEFAVIPGEPSVENGKVTFNVSNKGPDDVHEFVVFKTDLSPIDLPTNPNGSVNEEGEGIELIDEIEDIPVGETQSVTVDLESGSYVLICNIYTKSEKESHYQEGMRTSFTVE